jgi:tetratricopeptide (TPR) repeat protein/tRNA A-37 threonylcarbamoyl transferase component Bud32
MAPATERLTEAGGFETLFPDAPVHQESAPVLVPGGRPNPLQPTRVIAPVATETIEPTLVPPSVKSESLGRPNGSSNGSSGSSSNGASGRPTRTEFDTLQPPSLPASSADSATLVPPTRVSDSPTLVPPPSRGEPGATPWMSTPEATDRSVLPGYEVLGVLGRGGMGVVYKARQTGLNRIVALKMILAGSQASKEELQRFHTEAEAVAALQHPNIVQIHDMGVRDGRPFFSLEFCEGGSLQARLDGTPLLPPAAARLVRTLADAVGYAHEQGIIHRDLKPANILLVEPPSHPLALCTPKITDFGLAKRLNDDQGQTATEAILGTPTYMAPEQALGRTKEAGPPSDVYALGAILYDLLTGRPPFRGATALDTLQLVQTAEPVPPSRLQPNVPPDLQTITLKCLEKDPARRYRNARELASDLNCYLEGKPILARASSPLERGLKFARRNPTLTALLAMMVLTPVIVAGVSLWYSTQLAVERDVAIWEKQRADEARQEAEEAEREAKSARKDALTQRDRAKQSAELARLAQRDAQMNFLRVQQAASRLMRLSEARLRYVAGSEPIRKEILRDTLEMSLLFTQRSAKDTTPETLLRAAHAHRLVGDIEERLNNPSAALLHYEQSIAYYNEVLANKQAAYLRPDVQNERVETVLLRWRVLESVAPDCAEGGLDEAMELLDRQPQEVRRSWQSRATRAAVLTNRAIAHENQGRKTEALRDLDTALELLEQLSRDPEIQPFPRRRLEIHLEQARGWINRAALILSKASRESDPRSGAQTAIESCQRAIELLEKQIGEVFDPAVYREIGRAITTKSLALSVLGRRDEALRVAQQAVQRFRAARKSAPENTDARQLLAQSLADLGIAQYQANELPAARDSLREAETLLLKLSEESPSTLLFVKDLARVRSMLGLALLRLGDAETALKPLRDSCAGFGQLDDAEGLQMAKVNLARGLHRAAEEAQRSPRRVLGYLTELRDLRREWYREASPWYRRGLAGTDLLLTLQAVARVQDDLRLHADLSATLEEMLQLAAPSWPGFIEVLLPLARGMKAEPERADRYGAQALRILRAQTRTEALERFLSEKDLAPLRALPDYLQTLDAMPRPKP